MAEMFNKEQVYWILNIFSPIIFVKIKLDDFIRLLNTAVWTFVYWYICRMWNWL